VPDGWAARPAVLPAAALLAGTWFGLRAVFLPLPLAALLAAAGVALGGRKGGAVAAFAAGLVAAAVAGAPHPLDLAPSDRPLAVTARVAEHPRPSDDGWSMRLAVERVAHRGRVWTAAGDDLLWLTLPGDEAPPPLGSRLRLRGRPSRSPGFANRLPPPPGPWRMRVKSRRLLEVEAEPGPWAARAGRWRQRVEAAVDEASAGRASPGVALTRALVLGDAGGVPERWRRGLRRSGLAHLLAVSGLHVALVAAVALGLAWPVPLRWRWLAALPAVALYVAVAGPRPALLRAALMGTIAAVALLAGRPASGGNALAVAAALLALTRPALVDDLGFRLTVAATGGLVFLAPPAAAALRRAADAARERLPPHLAIRLFVALPLRLLRALARPLTASVAAQVASAPFALPAFHLLSFGSPLTTGAQEGEADDVDQGEAENEKIVIGLVLHRARLRREPGQVLLGGPPVAVGAEGCLDGRLQVFRLRGRNRNCHEPVPLGLGTGIGTRPPRPRTTLSAPYLRHWALCLSLLWPGAGPYAEIRNSQLWTN